MAYFQEAKKKDKEYDLDSVRNRYARMMSRMRLELVPITRLLEPMEYALKISSDVHVQKMSNFLAYFIPNKGQFAVNDGVVKRWAMSNGGTGKEFGQLYSLIKDCKALFSVTKQIKLDF